MIGLIIIGVFVLVFIIFTVRDIEDRNEEVYDKEE